MIRSVEKHFILAFVIAIATGIGLPMIGQLFAPYLLYFLLTILFFNCLKIDVKEVIHTVKRPKLLIYLCFIILVATPVVFFYLTKLLYPSLVIPVLLLTAMPPAMAAAALTDLVRGKSALSLVLMIATSLLCPFTIPLLIKVFLGTQVSVSATAMIIMLSKSIFPPFILALVCRKLFFNTVEKTRRYYGGINVLLISCIIMGIMGKNSAYILGNLGEVMNGILYMFFISILLHIAGWYSVYKLGIRDKISMTVSTAYMNIALAVVFAEMFFTPVVGLGLVLYHFPWDVMLVPFRAHIKGAWPRTLRTGMWAFNKRQKRRFGFGKLMKLMNLKNTGP